MCEAPMLKSNIYENESVIYSLYHFDAPGSYFLGSGFHHQSMALYKAQVSQKYQ